MWIVFIEIDPGFTRAFTAAKELGLRILWIGRKLDDSFTSGDLCDKCVAVNELTAEEITSAIQSIVATGNVSAVWTLKDQFVPLAAGLMQSLGCNGRFASPELVATTKDKGMLRNALAGTPFNPWFKLIDLSKERNVERPLKGQTIVIKPPLGYSSIGVEKVKPDDDFQAALARTSSILTKIAESVPGFADQEFNPKTTVLIEQFVGGTEFSAEVFAHNGQIECLGVCGKSEMVPPYFEEISYCMPAPIDHATTQRIMAAAVDIMGILGLSSGMAHVEVKVTESAVTVLDIGLRLGGSGLTHDLVHASTGIDLVKAVLAELAGLNPEPYLTKMRTDIGLLYLLQVKDGGRLVRSPLAKADEGKDNPKELVNARSFVGAGDQLTGYPNYSGTPGFAFFHIPGSDRTAYCRADELLKEAAELFALDYET